MQDKRAEQIFFDSFAEEQAYDVFDDRGYQRLLKEFSALVRPAPEERLLDVGCGSGAFIDNLSASGLKVTGVDISFNNVRLAAEKSPAFSFAAADVEELPFADDEFDIVTFSGLLHHLPVLDKALSESRRVLKPGGRVFAYDPNGRNPAMWLYRSPRSPLHSREGWTVNERLLFAEEIERCLSAAGFQKRFVPGRVRNRIQVREESRGQKYVAHIQFLGQLAGQDAIWTPFRSLSHIVCGEPSAIRPGNGRECLR